MEIIGRKIIHLNAEISMYEMSIEYYNALLRTLNKDIRNNTKGRKKKIIVKELIILDRDDKFAIIKTLKESRKELQSKLKQIKKDI